MGDPALEHLRQPPRGRVLHPRAGADVLTADRRTVAQDLADLASHVWSVSWSLPTGMAWRQQVLGDPVVHLTVEDTGPERRPLHGQAMPGTLVHGPETTVWSVELPPTGRTSGIAFRPGGFAALLDLDASALVGRVVRAEDLLAGEVLSPPRGGARPRLPSGLLPGLGDLEATVLATEDDEGRWQALEAWLRELRGAAEAHLAGDAAYLGVRTALAHMGRADVVRVGQVAQAVPCSTRTLQRWFTRYVGLSPLQVLRRRRMQDAVAALDMGRSDLAALAVELGWADHAHFSRDFRALMGHPPETYRRSASRPREASGGGDGLAGP